MNFLKKHSPNWLVLLLVILNLGIIASFWFPRKERGPKGNTEFFIRELRLDKDQAERFRGERRAYHQACRPLFEKERELRAQLIEVTTKEQIDSLKKKEILTEVYSIQKKLVDNFDQHFAELSKICTPEQRQEMARIFRIKRNPPH